MLSRIDSRRLLASSQSIILAILLLSCDELRGPPGMQGPPGEQGLPGLDLDVESLEETVLNQNYTKRNPHHISVPLGDSLGIEPVVLFFGIENENGVFVAPLQSSYGVSVIWGGDDADTVVPGTRGWYYLVPDKTKRLLKSNYQIKFVYQYISFSRAVDELLK